VRVGVDATPLLGVRTGVGRYVEHLLGALASPAYDGLDLVATAFSGRGASRLSAALPPGVAARARPVPARVLQGLWRRVDLPPVELLSGPLQVFHGTNFLLPPLRRARGVLTVHDLAYLRMPGVVDAASRRYRELVPRGVRRAAVVVAPSQATAGDLADAYGVPAERVVVTPLGVAPEWSSTEPPGAEWLAARGLPSSYLLAVGTLEPRKDLATALRAVARLPPGTPPLVLAGPGGGGPTLDAAGLAPGRVHTTGYLSGDTLRRVVAGAACLVFPSLLEGYGLPPLEALAAGVPVVASDLPVCREVLGPHARFAPAGDADAFAAAIAATLADGGPTTRAERRAYASARTWQACADATLGAYRRALA